jgi:hypothetical protein
MKVVSTRRVVPTWTDDMQKQWVCGPALRASPLDCWITYMSRFFHFDARPTWFIWHHKVKSSLTMWETEEGNTWSAPCNALLTPSRQQWRREVTTTT